MRATQIMLNKGFGGAERYFVDLVRYLVRTGHEVQAICHRRSICGGALGHEAGLELRSVNLLGPWDLPGIRRIGRLVDGFSPDVVHGHLSRGASVGGRITGEGGPPLVVNMHNYIKFKRYRNVDFFIPTTNSQEIFLRNNGIPEEKISLIPNFSSFPPVEEVRQPSREPVRFLSYGRMVKEKGFRDLLEAFARIRRRGLDVRLLLGGDGPERTRIGALCRELEVADRVELPGWIENVGELLAHADVFVLPSHFEPFGIVVLEAMSMGVPIVATRTEGPMEVLDLDTAYFANIADVDSLATAMHTAAAEPEQRINRARTALERYRTTYHDSVIAPRIIDVYRRAVSAANGS